MALHLHNSLKAPNCEADCFMWSVLAGLHPIVDNPQRISHYKRFVVNYDFENIANFERHSQISINVYSLDVKDELVIPLQLRKCNFNREVKLFYHKTVDFVDKISIDHYPSQASLEKEHAFMQNFNRFF